MSAPTPEQVTEALDLVKLELQMVGADELVWDAFALIAQALTERPSPPPNLSVDCVSQGCRRAEFEQMAHEADEELVAERDALVAERDALSVRAFHLAHQWVQAAEKALADEQTIRNLEAKLASPRRD